MSRYPYSFAISGMRNFESVEQNVLPQSQKTRSQWQGQGSSNKIMTLKIKIKYRTMAEKKSLSANSTTKWPNSSEVSEGDTLLLWSNAHSEYITQNGIKEAWI